jgi:ferredoxin
METNRAEIDPEQCKGCGLCVESCRPGCLALGGAFNAMGYKYASFVGGKCTACGTCFYVCPEFGAVTVYQKNKRARLGP